MSKKKAAVITVSVTFCILAVSAAVCWWYNFSYGISISTESIAITKIHYEVGKVDISGSTTSSGAAFSGWDFTTEGNRAYIHLRYVPVNGKHRDGGFTITTNSLDGVDFVYVVGSTNEDQKLVWARNGSS